MKAFLLLTLISVSAIASQEFGVVCKNFDGVEKVNVRVAIPQDLFGCVNRSCGTQTVEESKFNAESFGNQSHLVPAKSNSMVIARPEYYPQSTKISGYQLELWLESATNPTIVYLKSAILLWSGINGRPAVAAGAVFIGSSKLDRRGILQGYYVSKDEDFALLCRLLD